MQTIQIELDRIEAKAGWRAGKTLGRTLYLDGVLVGMVDSPEIATAIVTAMRGTTGRKS